MRTVQLMKMLVAAAALAVIGSNVSMSVATVGKGRRRKNSVRQPLGTGGREELDDDAEGDMKVMENTRVKSCSHYVHVGEADLTAYHDKLSEKIDEVIEQSSAKFTDFHSGTTPWKPPKIHPEQLETNPGQCDPKNTNFTDSTDFECVRYMADHRNWESIMPMASVLSIARTIKFKVRFKSGAEGVLKLSQFKFLNEPYAELMGYEVDRALGINRVPPVAWVAIPVSWVRAVAGTMPPMYTQWVEKFVFGNKVVAKGVKTRCPFREESIRASLQIWVEGVVRYRKSSIYLNRNQLKSKHTLPEDPSLTPHARELSDSIVFDYLICNNDRTDKNTFAVPPRMIYLDQGSSFYGRDPPKGTPLRLTLKKRPTMCVFSARLKTTLEKYLGKKRLKTKLNAELTNKYTDIWSMVHKWQTGAVQSRLDDLAKVWAYCDAEGYSAYI
eukprot:TRINITY_DN13483_c0_g1_i1.p1 TRINITY_DN13483_c0_g1~~TRINITY_DN13483_c0_g1_i1.p1  ORF type:complete len:441 (+),score=39.68 TRINITY_DN13483_c0_g1_i1:92-1414(+)